MSGDHVITWALVTAIAAFDSTSMALMLFIAGGM